jgi:phospholipid/cholesterol/gamma-HCH transport system substrate-binding protein
MEEKVKFVVVGLFVLVLSAGLIGGVLWFSSGKSYRQVYDTYQVYMTESVSGLNLNSPVRYRGVEVGRVEKITLAPGNVEEVQLTLSIERGTPVKVDTVAVLQVQGLTGLAFIELTGGSRDAPELKAGPDEEYPVIKAGPSLLVRLDKAVTALLTNLNQTSENINALINKDNRQAIQETLADIKLLSRTLAERSTSIDTSLVNAARTMENVARLSNELPQLVQRIQHSTEAFDSMTSELARAGKTANSTLEGTNQFTHETLPEVHQLVIELRELTASLQHMSSDLAQNPNVLLYGKPAPPRGPGE